MASDRSRRRLVVSGVLGTLIIVTVYVAGGVVAGVKSAARAVVFPFAWTIDAVTRPIGHMVAGMVDYADLAQQNQQLREELGRATLRADENAAAAAQLRLLSHALHIPWAASLNTLVAQVTTNSPTNFSATVTIDKGKDEGVMDGMPVIADGGLVGRVVAVSWNTSTVRLLNDTGSVVEATFGNSQNAVLVSGEGLNNPLSVSGIPITAPLSVGSLLSTNGLQGGLFPPGLPVGRVTKLLVGPGASTYAISLKPTANLNSLSYVDVVLWEPST